MITHVAILQDGKIYSLPEPMRHDDVIRMMREICGIATPDGEQGFLYETGGKFSYVDREEAAEIAFTIGQMDSRYSGLLSEMIW